MATAAGGSADVGRAAIGEHERQLLVELCRRNLTELACAGQLTPAYGMEVTAERAEGHSTKTG